MAIELKKNGSCIVVLLPERIDMILSASIEKELYDIFQREKDCSFIMNMEKVQVLSSSGLRIFITAKRKLREQNREIVLCSINDEGIRETFTVSRLFDVIRVFPNEEEAVKALSQA